MAKVAESRDQETGGHVLRMREYSQILAEQLHSHGPYADQIDRQFLDDLYRSSPLHDIGKVGIRDEILLKPGKLTPQEFVLMRQHTTIGANILDQAVMGARGGGFLTMAALIARFHHERFDGTGYPAGLRGRTIPLPARIVALADVYDALTSARPYKRAFSPQQSRAMIAAESGRHFDPVIVEAFENSFPRFLPHPGKLSRGLPVIMGRHGLPRIPAGFRSACGRCSGNGGAVMPPSQPNTPEKVPSSAAEREGMATGAAAFLAADAFIRPNSRFRHVLLADDDTATRRIVARILETSGYEVRQATDGKAALDALRNDPPDFLITDWQMPGMDGLELCRAVRQEPLERYVYLMIVTSKSETKDMVQAIAAGADNFLAKPIVPGELLARLMSAARILELERRLREMARCDPLTKLLNRRTFFTTFQIHWNASARNGVPLSCVMIDVDLFKKINDTYGHPTGDSVLESLGRVLQGHCRRSDSVCRYGGEEFCAILPGAAGADALRWAERLRETIAETSISAKAGPLRVTVSLGVATRNAAAQTPEELLDRADQALLQAKRLGRNRTERFDT